MPNFSLFRDHERRRWLRFRDPVEVIAVWDVGNVRQAIERIERTVNTEGLWAMGYLAYEAAPAFDRALHVQPSNRALPLLWFGLYHEPDHLADLPSDDASSCTLGEWTPSVAPAVYREAIATVKERIALGDTYQVNYTYRLRASFQGDPWSLFLNLWQAQHAPYGAYLETDTFALCSASPELFFHLEDDRVVSEPMKGTAHRGRTLVEDEAQGQWLQASEKNRAENVMIVDMIRNDLGRIAVTGSVRAERLFDAARYPTLWQMTSTVSATTHASVADILAALFPCASVTGAPKVSTMGIIAGLESAPRGVYTGAIGYLAPGRRSQFSVAIRTVVIDRAQATAEYGVGSGIVWDSDADDEYRECQTKARILTVAHPDISLIESLLWEPDGGYFLLERHIQRLADSAAYFATPLDLAAIQGLLAPYAATLPAQPHKVRLLIASNGACSVEAAPIQAASSSPLRVALADQPVDSNDPYLYHKTTQRAVYERALASRPGCDDVLLWNERGEITESTRANLVLRLDGELVTPPISSGLLAGTFRAELLSQGVLREQVLRAPDLARAENVYLINSVRRWMSAKLADELAT